MVIKFDLDALIKAAGMFGWKGGVAPDERAIWEEIGLAPDSIGPRDFEREYLVAPVQLSVVAGGGGSHHAVTGAYGASIPSSADARILRGPMTSAVINTSSDLGAKTVQKPAETVAPETQQTNPFYGTW